MAYNMKGSPFQRNFGIGSPVKQQPDKKEFIENYVNPTVNLTKKQTGPVEDGSGGANFTKTNSTEKTGKLPQIDVNPAKYPGKKGNVSVNTDTDKTHFPKNLKSILLPLPFVPGLIKSKTKDGKVSDTKVVKAKKITVDDFTR
jgi:hypothetical protein